jgi:iron complex transport system substrate-binding protein
MRIVSLLPAATEIVCELGLRDQLVGRSHGCDFPEDVADLPVLTRARVDSRLPSAALDAQVRETLAHGLPLYELDEARLQLLAPDVVVTQAACEVCAISYEQVVRVSQRAAPHARVVSLQPARLRDVLEDVHTVSVACQVPERGARLVRELERRLTALRTLSPSTPAPRTAVLEWISPPMLAAHWVPDVLEAAGAQPVGPGAGSLSPYLTWEEIEALDLDALVIAPCGFGLARACQEADLDGPRISTLARCVLFMDGNAYWNRPGPRLVEAAEKLAMLLRGLPDAAAPRPAGAV